jgi:hypothetical protein
MAIYFYKRDREEYGWLSNFHRAPFTLGGICYQCVEHWFQSQKAITQDERLAIAAAESPKEAKQLGRACKMRKDWENVKEHVMMIGLSAKFEQNPELKRKLMETGEEALVEDSPTDNFWGKGPDGDGDNRLGKLLVMLRSYYRVQCHLVNVSVWKGLVLCTPWIAAGKPVEEPCQTPRSGTTQTATSATRSSSPRKGRPWKGRRGK